jgi:transcriptional regulator with XRE-family HTH domain
LEILRIIEKAENLIEEQGFDRSGLGKKLGFPSRYISDIKSGKSKNPGSDFILALINKLNFNPTWLETGEGEVFKSPEKALVNGSKTALKLPVLKLQDKWRPGQNWRTDESIWDFTDIFGELPKNVEGLFAIRVVGSAMIGAGIRHGDYVLFDSTEGQPRWDGIHVIGFDCELCCRRLEFDLDKSTRIYSVRIAELEKAFLIETISNGDKSKLEILGRVYYWLHPNTE